MIGNKIDQANNRVYPYNMNRQLGVERLLNSANNIKSGILKLQHKMA